MKGIKSKIYDELGLRQGLESFPVIIILELEPLLQTAVRIIPEL